MGDGDGADLGDEFLDRLPEAARTRLLDAGFRRRLPAGTPVVREGEPAHEVYVVLSGSLRVLRTSLDGREVVLGVRTGGEVLGEMSALGGHPRSASAWSIDEVELLVVPVAEFRAVLEEVPGAALALVETMADRLREATDQVLELGTDDALARVCRRLLEAADGEVDGSGPAEVELTTSQQELAARSGLSREAVVKALRTLRTIGWIKQDRRRVVLLDPAAVKERAGQPNG